MTKQEILDRVQDILNQEGNVQALDLLRHDLENDIIDSRIDTDVSAEHHWRKKSEDSIKEQFNRECD